MTNNNLIVYVNPDPNNPGNANGGLYTLPQSVYANKDYHMPVGTQGPALSLLSQGTVLANIPDDGTGLGGWCYLVNLPALQPPPVDGGQPAVRPRMTASQMLVAVKAMLNHTEPAVPGTQDQKILDAFGKLVQTHPTTAK